MSEGRYLLLGSNTRTWFMFSDQTCLLDQDFQS